jgi:hypothetical protein
MSYHTHEPEFDLDFYKLQNDIMEERYLVIFKSRSLSWDNYVNNARSRLGNNIYLMWIFLCGLETFLKQNNNLDFENKKNLVKSLYKDAEDRIYRIIGDDKKNADYIKSL